MRIHSRFALLVALVGSFAAPGFGADVPFLINYQGRLLDGTNLVNGSVGLSLRLYNVSGGGSILYEDSNSVTVVDGLYATMIGDNTASGSLVDALTNTTVYVETAVNGTVLTPRERIVAVAYALATRGILASTNGSFVFNPDANYIAPTIAQSVIGGGSTNSIYDKGAVIGGGQGNFIATFDFPVSHDYGTIGGGLKNSIGFGGALFGHLGTIAGGGYNSIRADYATIGGGLSNAAGGAASVISGGLLNSNAADNTVIAGGQFNYAAGESSTVGGGSRNRAGSSYATVAGGTLNVASDSGTTVGGGISNTAGQANVTIAGGTENYADGFSSTIGGGEYNKIFAGQRSTIGGGTDNRIQSGGGYSVIAGGDGNVIGTNASFSAILGGSGNTISGGNGSTIGGGLDNRVRLTVGTIAGGQANDTGTNALDATIGGGFHNIVSNWYGTVPGGYENVAGGSNTFAAGTRARALHNGAFVWSDSRTNGFASVTGDEFAVSASNGVRIADDLGTNRLDRIGRRFRDNGIYAWGFVLAAGTLNGNAAFGITSVTNVSQGVYNIVLDAAAFANPVNMCPIVTPEIDFVPSNAASLRLASVNTVLLSNRFVQVFMNNGSGAPTNNDFVFIVTGR